MIGVGVGWGEGAGWGKGVSRETGSRGDWGGENKREKPKPLLESRENGTDSKFQKDVQHKQKHFGRRTCWVLCNC